MVKIIIETDKGDCEVLCAGWTPEDIEHYVWSVRGHGYIVRTEQSILHNGCSCTELTKPCKELN